MQITTKEAAAKLAKVGVTTGIRNGELTVEHKKGGWDGGWTFLGKIDKDKVEIGQINSSLSRMGTGLKRIS